MKQFKVQVEKISNCKLRVGVAVEDAGRLGWLGTIV